jgi:hypothetical protein
MSEAKKQFPDPLVRQTKFPEPAAVFGFVSASLPEALKDGLLVVDTYVLLVPYATGKASLEQIRQTFSALVSQNRLRIHRGTKKEISCPDLPT